jgi:hypothetical protein
MEQIIHNLFISKKDLIQDNIEYKFLGKGGTGVVYKVKDNSNQDEIYAIKIIPKSKFNLNEYKIGVYLNGLLNSESINFIRTYDKIEYKDYILLKMELLEGNLAEWSKTLHTDQEWFLCILQIIINLRMLQQKINLFHRDMKPKNILYKNYDNQVKFIYELNDKTYEINTKTIFYITDFTHSKCDLNESKNNFISNYETLDNDLYELKSLPQRLRVDKLIKTKSSSELQEIASSSEYFKGYYEEEKKKIDNKLKSYPEHVREKHLLRNICYFIVENKLIKIDISDIMSEIVEDVLEMLLNEDIDIIIDKIYELIE